MGTSGPAAVESPRPGNNWRPRPLIFHPSVHMEATMSQSLAPEPGVEPHAGTDTGPCGLSSSQQDAVQEIVRQCLDARSKTLDVSDAIIENGVKIHYVRQNEMRPLIGYLFRTLQSILEECKRLT